MAALARVALAAAASLVGCRAAGIGTATGCPDELPTSEDRRLREFLRIHKSWPPVLRYPGALPEHDTAGWKQYMARKEAEVMAVTDPTWRWEYWLEHSQVLLLRNFTELGWGMGEMPSALHQKVVSHFRAEHAAGKAKDEVAIAGYVTGERGMVGLGKFEERITKETQKQVAAWAGLEFADLEPTSTYGIRTYYKNSTLKTHVDRVETHVLSAVYVVDRSNETGAKEPWNVVADPDWSGERKDMDVRPGQLFFYESAKLNHGRPTHLQEEYSAHVFIHFRPTWWNFKNFDRVYGLPEHWNDRKEEL